jgi:hypothetical protein
MADSHIGAKFSPGEVQARQDLGVGVTVAATLIGSMHWPLAFKSRLLTVCSHIRRTPDIHTRFHRPEHGS